MSLYTSNLCQSLSNLISLSDSCTLDPKLDLRFITSPQNSKVFFFFHLSFLFFKILYCLREYI